MFISSTFLEIYYGTDSKIARFFVDREPPADNLYWKGKLLYLRPAPGYLFIPLVVDLLLKLGIDRQQLLSEKFVGTLEQLGHISALEETKQISAAEAINKSAELVKDNCSDKDWYNNVLDYLNSKEDNFLTKLSPPFKALRRGDLFLFVLCAVHFSRELSEKIAEQWFALISTLLLLDDAEDIKADKQSGDENAFLESGMTAEGFNKIKALVNSSVEKITILNPTLALQLKKQYKDNVENADFFKVS